MRKQRKQVGDGLLLGEQETDYFHFISGSCGAGIRKITVDALDTVGFWFTAKYQECGERFKVKVSANWGKNLAPYIEAAWKRE